MGADLITPQLYSPLYLLIVEGEGRVEPLVSLSLSLSRLSLAFRSLASLSLAPLSPPARQPSSRRLPPTLTIRPNRLGEKQKTNHILGSKHPCSLEDHNLMEYQEPLLTKYGTYKTVKTLLKASTRREMAPIPSLVWSNPEG